MKELTHRFENSALVHRVHGTIHVKFAGVINDPNSKQRHLRDAVLSAKKAVSLNPNSIEFAHFYANLLFEVANDAGDYQDVVTECQRALAIENSNSVCHVKESGIDEQLRCLIQKSNAASISSWMKKLEGSPGNEMFRLIPVNRLWEDPLESRYFQMSVANARRPNEIKKASKTPEERRKEIEVRVAAARLMQQKCEQVEDAGESKDGSGLHSKGGLSKIGERRKHGSSRRNASASERKDQVRSFWKSMSSEMKRGLLSVKISDLLAHFRGSSNNDGGQVCEILSEALAFGETNKTWKFWVCCRCGEKFPDAEAHMQHVVQEHMGNLLPKVQSALPQNVDNEWAEMLANCSWKPLDLTASVSMLENQSKPEDSEFSIGENHKERTDCRSDRFCSEEAWESFPEKKSLADGCNGSCYESKADDGNSKVECRTCGRKEGSKVYSLPNSWPLLDDTKRATLLEKISSLFQVLVRNKCLAISHLQKVIQFTMEELQALFPDSRILSCGVDQTPLCICFLGDSQLRKIIKFLQEVSHACGVGRYPRNVISADSSNCPQLLDCEDRIVLNEDASSLLLNESLLVSEGMRNAVGSESSVGVSEMGVQSGSDSMLSWIYAGFPSGEQLAAWCRIREERSQQGTELLQMLEKEFSHLQRLCDRKYEHLEYEEALQGLVELCLEESKKREHVTEFSHSYDSILRKRRDELVEGKNIVMFVSNRLELEAISNVLKEAENLDVNQFGHEDAYGEVTPSTCDLEAGDDDGISKDSLRQVDTCIEIAIQRHREQLSVELSKFDARIMRNVASMQRLELKLESVSSLDYRSILLPLVKSFMRARLEDLAEKDATEKSDAAREAFLAELALDSRKGTGNGNDNSKHMQEKMKDKKRNKDSRKNKDSKVGSSSEQLEGADQYSLAVTSDGDCVDTDIVVLESGGNLKELEEDSQRKIELEAEERKLEETLEYQRRLENEAKQKLLSEQHRRNIFAASEDVAEDSGDISFKPGISEAPGCKQEPLVLNNVFAERMDSLQRNLGDTSDCSGIADGQCARNANSYLERDSSNEGILVDGILASEQPTRRKGKHGSSKKVPEGRYKVASYVKENVNLENSTINIMQKDQVWNLDGDLSLSVRDGGSKTLRQLRAQEDEEERFQEDLKKAVQQSLDTFQAREKLPLVPNSRVVQRSLQDMDSLGVETGEVMNEIVNEMDSLGAGLQNEVGEYNCFLNVIIQSLWHLRQFREEFLRRSTSVHVHIGDPCVVCALFDILAALSMASGNGKGEPVAPAALRVALSNLYPESNFFQEGQMNDASEVLAVIFECLHQSFGSNGSDSGSVECNCLGSWDCASPSCVAHALFGMDIFERMNCDNCGLESRHLKYTSFFHNVNASALRSMKVTHAENSFDELLNLVEMNHQLACNPEAGGCGKLNHIHHFLSKPPHIFTTVLGWQNTSESVDDIAATLAAIGTGIDISVLYRGLDQKNVYCLVSVVCYYGQHYHCFAYSYDYERWIMYDDKMVKVIGTWEEVLSMCKRGHLQPQVLFYEVVN